MKFIAISTSPRKGQNTEKLLQIIVNKLKSLDVEAELYSLANKNITPCRGCNACQRGKSCIINDDISEVLQKMKEADGIIIGTPTYFYDVNAQCKILIDRSYAVEPLNGNKVGGIVTFAGSLGHSSTIKTLEMFYRVHGITNAGFLSVYSPIEGKEKAIKSSEELAEKMVKIAKIIKDVDDGSFDALNHFSYGTHTM